MSISLPGSSQNHDRRPLEGFTGCPSVLDLSAAVGFEDFDAKSCVIGDESDNHGVLFSGLEQENDGFSDFFVWDVPTMVSLDDLIVTTDKTHNFQATVVPPLPKVCNFYSFHSVHQLGCGCYTCFPHESCALEKLMVKAISYILYQECFFFNFYCGEI